MSAHAFEVVWGSKFQIVDYNDDAEFTKLFDEFKDTVLGQQQFFTAEPRWIEAVFDMFASALKVSAGDADIMYNRFHEMSEYLHTEMKLVSTLKVIDTMMYLLPTDIIRFSVFNDYMTRLMVEATAEKETMSLDKKRTLIIHQLSIAGIRAEGEIPDKALLKSLLTELDVLNQQH